MTHTYEALKKKTIAELREIAKDIEHEAVQGYTRLEQGTPAAGRLQGARNRLARPPRGGARREGGRQGEDARNQRQEGHGCRERRSRAAAPARRQYHRLNHTLRTAAKHSPES